MRNKLFEAAKTRSNHFESIGDMSRQTPLPSPLLAGRREGLASGFRKGSVFLRWLHSGLEAISSACLIASETTKAQRGAEVFCSLSSIMSGGGGRGEEVVRFMENKKQTFERIKH